jgi:hypothetical protein
MPAAIAVPAIMSAVGTGAAMYSAKKSRDAMKPDPATQRMQTQALQMQNDRMKMFQPLLQRMAAGASSRLPASYGAPSIGQMRTPGAGQAMSQLARAMPPPAGARQAGRQRIIWGD